jgi:hypothetical protein
MNMIWQEIIVGIILLTAAGVTLARLVRFFSNPFRKCKGCAQACGGCSLEELKKQVRSQKPEVRRQVRI